MEDWNLSDEIRGEDRFIENAHLLLRWGGLIPVEYVREFINRLRNEFSDEWGNSEQYKHTFNIKEVLDKIDKLAGEKLI